MSKAEATIWGIHAGKTGDAEALFFKKDVVALGWPKMGDLSKLHGDRESFKKAYASTFPERKPGGVAPSAGQMYRFLFEMNAGDLVLYPSRTDRHIHYARVKGGYQYRPSLEPAYPHIRAVEWVGSFARTKFSQGALYELGSAMSLFQIKNYADEYLAALEGKVVTTGVAAVEIGAPDAEQIEEITRDFVLKKLSQELKGHPLSDLVAHLLELMGYWTRVSPEGADGGIDIIAHKDELGFEPPIVKVQVKSGDGSTGDPIVSALYGKVSNNEFGLLVSLGEFTNQAKAFAKSKSNLRLISGDEFVELLLSHYDELDARYKGLLPLRKVWVPETAGETAED
jgi:restriction system protein